MKVVSATLVLSFATLSAVPYQPPAPVVERFLTRSEEPLTQYRALRSLTASTRGGRMTASLVARTELTEAGEFRYEVVSEEGSGVIRRKVLYAALEAERKARESGDSRSAALTPENYEFAPDTEIDGDLLRIDLAPRRKHVMLLEGAMFLTRDSEDLVRVEGRLSKRPSFWTRRVDIVRRYDRLAGVRVPVAMESTAQVLLVGRSTFAMTYEYETVNGRAVTEDAEPAGESVSTDVSGLLRADDGDVEAQPTRTNSR